MVLKKIKKVILKLEIVIIWMYLRPFHGTKIA